MGTLKARRTLHTYLVDYGHGSEWAYYPGDDLLTLGTDRTTVFDPASDQWWIRPFGGGQFVFSYSNADGSAQQYKVLPVNSSGYGTLADSVEVETFQAKLDVAPNGQFMVAASGDGTTVGVHLWTGTTFNPTAVDTITVASVNHIAISPDSATVIFGVTGSPYVVAYSVSAAGFGSTYSAPPSLPAFNNVGVTWHPSGEAVVLAWTLTALAPAQVTTAAWAWSAGWGARYADSAEMFTATNAQGTASLPHFAPDGATLLVPRLYPGDSADGQFRVYNFTLADGITTRVAASASPIAGPISFNQTAYSGRLIALGAKADPIGLVTYTFTGGVIGPGVAHPEYYDPEAGLPIDGFVWRPYFLCFSRDGTFLLGANNSGDPAGAGIFRLFGVATDGALTQLGATFTDPFASGLYRMAWRQG